MTVAPIRRAPRGYILLWIVVILSLLFNIALIVGGVFALRAYRTAAADAAVQIKSASAELDANRMTDFVIPVVVDEVLPVQFEVAYADTFQVPINTSIPVNTSVSYRDTFAVPINETLTIDTDFDVEVQIPLINRVVPLNIPIKTDNPHRSRDRGAGRDRYPGRDRRADQPRG